MKLYIVLGYLGSGKSTYVNRLVSALGAGTALVVNDFDSVSVDEAILAQYHPFVLAGGSMFCSCKSQQFVDIMSNIATGNFDNVVVESTGLANPYNLYQLIELVNSRIDGNIQLVEVVTVVDALNIEKVLFTVNSSRLQIAFASCILVNKCDLVTAVDTVRIDKLLTTINSQAYIEHTTLADRQNCQVRDIVVPAVDNVVDIHMQKCHVKLDSSVTLQQLEALSQAISSYCHRAKGVLEISDYSGVYQYSFGRAEYSTAVGKANNIVTFLTTSPVPLAGSIEQTISQNNIKAVILH